MMTEGNGKEMLFWLRIERGSGKIIPYAVQIEALFLSPLP